MDVLPVDLFETGVADAIESAAVVIPITPGRSLFKLASSLLCVDTVWPFSLLRGRRSSKPERRDEEKEKSDAELMPGHSISFRIRGMLEAIFSASEAPLEFEDPVDFKVQPVVRQ